MSRTHTQIMQEVVDKYMASGHKLRQHMVYVYASLSRLDFQGLLENAIVVF